MYPQEEEGNKGNPKQGNLGTLSETSIHGPMYIGQMKGLSRLSASCVIFQLYNALVQQPGGGDDFILTDVAIL